MDKNLDEAKNLAADKYGKKPPYPTARINGSSNSWDAERRAKKSGASDEEARQAGSKWSADYHRIADEMQKYYQGKKCDPEIAAQCKAFDDWHVKQYGEFEDHTSGNEICYIGLQLFKPSWQGFVTRTPYLSGKTNERGELEVRMYDGQGETQEKIAATVLFANSAEAKAWWERAKAEGKPSRNVDNPWKISKAVVKPLTSENATGRKVADLASKTQNVQAISLDSEFGKCWVYDTTQFKKVLADGEYVMNNDKFAKEWSRWKNKGEKISSKDRSKAGYIGLRDDEDGEKVRDVFLHAIMNAYFDSWNLSKTPIEFDDVDFKTLESAEHEKAAADEKIRLALYRVTGKSSVKPGRKIVHSSYFGELAYDDKATESWYLLMTIFAKTVHDSKLANMTKETLSAEADRPYDLVMHIANKQLDDNNLRPAIISKISSIMREDPERERTWVEIINANRSAKTESLEGDNMNENEMMTEAKPVYDIDWDDEFHKIQKDDVKQTRNWKSCSDAKLEVNNQIASGTTYVTNKVWQRAYNITSVLLKERGLASKITPLKNSAAKRYPTDAEMKSDILGVVCDKSANMIASAVTDPSRTMSAIDAGVAKTIAKKGGGPFEEALVKAKLLALVAIGAYVIKGVNAEQPFKDKLIELIAANWPTMTWKDFYKLILADSNVKAEMSKLCKSVKSSLGLGESLETGELDEMSESIEKHDTLNPKLFDDSGKMHEDVREAIQGIADKFLETLAEDEIKIDVKDIRLVGSNASYNYNDSSDMDVHIIADGRSLECSDDLYPLLYGAKSTIFNLKHTPTIKGIPVEVYIEIEGEKEEEEPIEEQLTDAQRSAIDALIKDEEEAIDGYEKAEPAIVDDAEKQSDLLAAEASDTIYHIKHEEEEHIRELKDLAREIEDENVIESLEEARSEKRELRSNGLYSVMKDEWVKEPVAEDIPEIDIDAFDEEYQPWEDRAQAILDDASSTSEDIVKYINELYELRKNALDEGGEYSFGNLIFKQIRGEGLLDELKDLRNQRESEELSLDESVAATRETINKIARDIFDTLGSDMSDEDVMKAGRKRAADQNVALSQSNLMQIQYAYDYLVTASGLTPACEMNESAELEEKKKKRKKKKRSRSKQSRGYFFGFPFFPRCTRMLMPHRGPGAMPPAPKLPDLPKGGNPAPHVPANADSNAIMAGDPNPGYGAEGAPAAESLEKRESSLTERIDSKQRHDLVTKITRATHEQPIIQDNGRFDIYNVREQEVDTTIAQLNKLSFVENVRKTAGRYDFSHYTGFGKVPQLWTVTGHIKDVE